MKHLWVLITPIMGRKFPGRDVCDLKMFFKAIAESFVRTSAAWRYKHWFLDRPGGEIPWRYHVSVPQQCIYIQSRFNSATATKQLVPDARFSPASNNKFPCKQTAKKRKLHCHEMNMQIAFAKRDSVLLRNLICLGGCCAFELKVQKTCENHKRAREKPEKILADHLHCDYHLHVACFLLPRHMQDGWTFLRAIGVGEDGEKKSLLVLDLRGIKVHCTRRLLKREERKNMKAHHMHHSSSTFLMDRMVEGIPFA